jgi:hypothetical protein
MIKATVHVELNALTVRRFVAMPMLALALGLSRAPVQLFEATGDERTDARRRGSC